MNEPPVPPSRREVIEVSGNSLDVATWGSGRPDIVMLHDGLGSVAQWRGLPSALATASGQTVVAYDRAGHGQSLPAPTGAWSPRWLHDEAIVLGALLEALDASDAVLVGHSDGGSIAAIHASQAPSSSPLILLAAHSWVEQKTVDEIVAMRANRPAIVERLGRFHAEPEALFDAWSLVWTGAEFADWDIRGSLAAINNPTLVLQGDQDEYASSEHATATAAAIGNTATASLLPGAGHLLHHEQPEAVTSAIVSFVEDSRI